MLKGRIMSHFFGCDERCVVPRGVSSVGGYHHLIKCLINR